MSVVVKAFCAWSTVARKLMVTILFATFSLPASATVIYTYTGDPYNGFFGGSTSASPNEYDGSSNVSVTLKFDAFLPPDFGLAGQDEDGDFYEWQDATFLPGFELTISDGVQSFNSDTDFDSIVAWVVTNANRDIIRWNIRAGDCANGDVRFTCPTHIRTHHVYQEDPESHELRCLSTDLSFYYDEPENNLSHGKKRYSLPEADGTSACDNRPFETRSSMWSKSEISDVPEPSLFGLLGFGVFAIGLARRRRKLTLPQI